MMDLQVPAIMLVMQNWLRWRRLTIIWVLFSSYLFSNYSLENTSLFWMGVCKRALHSVSWCFLVVSTFSSIALLDILFCLVVESLPIEKYSTHQHSSHYFVFYLFLCYHIAVALIGTTANSGGVWGVENSVLIEFVLWCVDVIEIMQVFFWVCFKRSAEWPLTFLLRLQTIFLAFLFYAFVLLFLILNRPLKLSALVLFVLLLLKLLVVVLLKNVASELCIFDSEIKRSLNIKNSNIFFDPPFSWLYF